MVFPIREIRPPHYSLEIRDARVLVQLFQGSKRSGSNLSQVGGARDKHRIHCLDLYQWIANQFDDLSQDQIREMC